MPNPLADCQWTSLEVAEQRNEGNGDRNGHTRINFIVSFVEISPVEMWYDSKIDH